MKIQAIKKLILAEKECYILTGQQGQQWIGTARAIFRVDDGLKLRSSSIKGLFDLDTNQEKRIEIIEQDLEMADIWPMMRKSQNQMTVCPLGINNFGGVELLASGGRMYLCSVNTIKAAVDTADYREYMLGYDRFHAPLIIVNDGLIFAGVIRPEATEKCKFILKELEDWAQMIAAGTGVEETPEESDAEEQISMV